MNKDIDLIMNNPKKAINKLALPLIVSNLFMVLNNIIDGVWVAGLGPNPIAAIGFVTPLFLAIVGFANGLGAGANSLIARYIGAQNYENAVNGTLHSIMLSIIVTVIVTIVLLVILKPLLIIMGAESVIDYSLSYGYIVFAGSFSIFIPAMLSAIFRTQGDIKRSAYPLILNAIINMVIDPIFIYTMHLGVGGAAIATVIASAIPMIPMLYWIFVKKDNYIKVNLTEYKRNLQIYKDILVVGIPASLEQFIISFLSIIVNYWLIIISGTIAVAAYTTTWRLVLIGIVPLIAIGISSLTVGGVAYGARNYQNIKISLNYGIKIGLISSAIICAIFFIFAEPLSFLFSYSATSEVLAPKIIEAIRILCFFILFIPLGIVSGNLFQSMGKGTISLAFTVLRSFITQIIFAGLFGFVFKWGDFGIYLGLVVGMAVGATITYIYINYYLKKIRGYFND